MIFSTHPQGSEEWFKDRAGRITASSIQKLLSTRGTTKLKPLSDGAETYIYEVAAEALTGIPKDQIDGVYALEWGKRFEPEARASFEMQTDLKVDQVGFCIGEDKDNGLGDYNDFLGFSADGKIDSIKAGWETKCPLVTSNHLAYICTGKIKKDYIAQVQFSMMISGFEKWYLCSYDHRLKHKTLHYNLIERDEEYIKVMKERTIIAIEALKHVIKRIKG